MNTKTIMEALERKKGEVKHFLAVMSGKGGVGKSSITALLVSGMQKRSLGIRIPGVDVNGTSIPRIMPPRHLRRSPDRHANLTAADVLVVTSPQFLASIIVRKAINMARRVGTREVAGHFGTRTVPGTGPGSMGGGSQRSFRWRLRTGSRWRPRVGRGRRR